MLVAIEVAVGGISAAVQAVEYRAGDLLGSSVTCADRQQQYRGLAQCDLRQSAQSLGDIQTQLIRGEGEKLSRALRKDYFSQIETALTSQFEAATWLAGENLLRAEQGVSGHSLQKAIDLAMAKCSGEERALLEGLSAKFKNAKATGAINFASLPQESADQSKEFVEKRMVIAWLEINRIERFLTDRPLSKIQKQELRMRIEKIRATYPLVATSHGAYTLNQLALNDYGQISFVDSTQSHPQIDQILFPSEVDGKYAVIPAGKNKQQGHEGLVNQILAKPLTPRVEKEIRALMVSSLKNSFESIGGLCQLNACQTMQLSLPTTASKINDMADESRNLTTAAACSCKLMVPTEMVGIGLQLAMTGTAIGGAVLCPFTMGMGCFISAASTAGLMAVSAANTYAAVKDLDQAKPIGVAARALPGLSNESRAAAKQAENRAAGRVIGGFAMTATGAISGSQMVRQGFDAREVLSTAWRPANTSEMAGYFQTHVREVGQTARKIYKDNVEYFPHLRPDAIKALKSHDMEKFLSFKNLAEKYGYRGVPRAIVDDLADGAKFSHLVSKDGKYVEMSISDSLYALWGHSPESLQAKLSLAKSATERRNVEALLKLREYVVTSMESLDNAIMLPAYKTAGSAAARVEMRLIELMADKAARTGNGITVSEMGRAVYPTRELYDKFGVEGLAKHIADPNSPEELQAARVLVKRIGLENIKRVTERIESHFVSEGLPTSFKNTVLNAFPRSPLPAN